MPLGIKSPLTLPTGKPDLGCLGATPSYSFRATRHTPKGLQVTAAAVHPWPWRSSGSDSSNSNVREGVKPQFPFAPRVFGQSAKQVELGSLWHAVDLQEGSASSAPSAMEFTAAAAKTFRVQSSQQLQVHNHEEMHSICSECVLQCALCTSSAYCSYPLLPLCQFILKICTSLSCEMLYSCSLQNEHEQFHDTLSKLACNIMALANSRLLLSCRMSSIALCWQRLFTRSRRKTMPRWLALLLLCVRISPPHWSLCKGCSGPYLTSLTGSLHTFMHAVHTGQCRKPELFHPFTLHPTCQTSRPSLSCVLCKQ